MYLLKVRSAIALLTAAPRANPTAYPACADWSAVVRQLAVSPFSEQALLSVVTGGGLYPEHACVRFSFFNAYACSRTSARLKGRYEWPFERNIINWLGTKSIGCLLVFVRSRAVLTVRSSQTTIPTQTCKGPFPCPTWDASSLGWLFSLALS